MPVTFRGVTLPHVLGVDKNMQEQQTEVPIPLRNQAYRAPESQLGSTLIVHGQIREVTPAAARIAIDALRALNDGTSGSFDIGDGTTPVLTMLLVDPYYKIAIGQWFAGKSHVDYTVNLVETS